MMMMADHGHHHHLHHAQSAAHMHAMNPYAAQGVAASSPSLPAPGRAFPGAAVSPMLPPTMASSPAMMAPMVVDDGSSPVILVNKLDETRVTCDTLFNLFGGYGDVVRVKILHNKRSTAMVQFANGAQAKLGMTLFLNETIR